MPYRLGSSGQQQCLSMFADMRYQPVTIAAHVLPTRRHAQPALCPLGCNVAQQTVKHRLCSQNVNSVVHATHTITHAVRRRAIRLRASRTACAATQPPSAAAMQPKALISNVLLQACLQAADDSYRVQPDLPSKFLHHAPAGAATSIFAFPGSHTMGDWVLNADFQQEPAAVLGAALTGGRVHTGFARRALEVMGGGGFEAELAGAVAAGNAVIFTGHSLGGAVATLATLVLLSRQAPRCRERVCSMLSAVSHLAAALQSLPCPAERSACEGPGAVALA